MITKLSTYVTDNVNPYKNLAIEEFLTFHVQPSECILFLWQNRHTVVIGKNQNAWKECKVQKLEEDGGHLVRRLSGGGAVFHDLGNLNFTFCVREEDYDVQRQLNVILRAVRSLGIMAEKTGRNDITADGRKFSGNAFFKSKGCCYHHGTLLVNVDKNRMAEYLNVSAAKLQSKGVDSVRSRTVNLTEFKEDLTISLLKEKLQEAFEQEYECRAAAIREKDLDWTEIQQMEERFSSWNWKFGRKIPFDHKMERRFSWGELELQFHVSGGILEEVNVYSDAMEYQFAQQLSELWKGCLYAPDALTEQLQKLIIDSENAAQIKQDIAELLKEQFVC